MELLLEAPDVHLLPESKAVSIDSVVLTPCKIVHERTKSAFVEILRGPHARDSLQSITVLLLGETEFLYNDMDDGQLFLIKGHASVLFGSISGDMAGVIICMQHVPRHGESVNRIGLFAPFNEKTEHH